MTDFANALASSTPAPGGGSVSALAADLGAALTSMVCRLTIGRQKYAGVQKEMEEILLRCEQLRSQFHAMIDEDTEAFNRVMAAYGLPKETEKQKAKRTNEIQDAMKAATLVPLLLVERCIDALALVKTAVEKGNQNSVSDAGVAAFMLHAGAEGAALNVKINLGSLDDAGFVQQTTTKLAAYRTSLDTLTEDIFAAVDKHLE